MLSNIEHSAVTMSFKRQEAKSSIACTKEVNKGSSSKTERVTPEYIGN
jgi:hypothetical protein